MPFLRSVRTPLRSTSSEDRRVPRSATFETATMLISDEPIETPPA